MGFATLNPAHKLPGCLRLYLLVLVFAQVLALAHGIAHAAHADEGKPPCVECLVYGHFGAALPPSLPPPPAPVAAIPPVAAALHSAVVVESWVYRSRGPPV